MKRIEVLFNSGVVLFVGFGLRSIILDNMLEGNGVKGMFR